MLVTDKHRKIAVAAEAIAFIMPSSRPGGRTEIWLHGEQVIVCDEQVPELEEARLGELAHDAVAEYPWAYDEDEDEDEDEDLAPPDMPGDEIEFPEGPRYQCGSEALTEPLSQPQAHDVTHQEQLVRVSGVPYAVPASDLEGHG